MSPSEPHESANKIAQSYFRKVHRTYQEGVGRESVADVYERIKQEIGPRLQGLVLDIGSGGLPPFETDSTRTVVSLDYVFESLKNSAAKNVFNVTGDILRLPLKTSSVDRIIIQYVIHYLTDPPFEKTGRRIRQALAETARVLRTNGTIFFVNSMVPRALEYAQWAAYGASYYLLKALARPTVFFPSVPRFRRLLAEHGLVPERVHIIDWGNMAGASQGLFPNLRFPLKYLPVKCLLISATKAQAK